MRTDAQPIKLLGRLHLTQSDIIAVKAFRLAEFCRQRRVLLGTDRSHGRDAIRSRAAPLEHFDRYSDRRLAAPFDVRLVGEDLRLWRMIDILHEKGVALAWREYPDGLGGDGPLREPLNDRTEPVGAAEKKMVAFGLRQQRFNGCAPLRHLPFGKARVFGLNNARQVRRERSHDCPSCRRCVTDNLSWTSSAAPRSCRARYVLPATTAG